MNERASFYTRLAGHHLRPLWEVIEGLVPPVPRPKARAALWRYDEIRPSLTEAGAIITASEAVRRVLVLENPGMPGSSLVSSALFAGLQLILPGEIAPSHRHTQNALRFVVEGEGAYTSVDGERTRMAPGDFIITPAWTWHDHGNDGNGPVIWLDGLDIPIVALHDASFAESYPEPVQPLERSEGDCETRWGSNMAPFGHQRDARTSPLFSYPYAPSRAAVAAVAANGPVDPAHGVRMRYVNPVSGSWAIPTLGTWLQWLPAGFRGVGARSTDATVCCCVEGHGSVRIGEEVFDWGPRDIFVVPSWNTRSISAYDEAVLFCFSDRPVQQVLGLLREESDPVR